VSLIAIYSKSEQSDISLETLLRIISEDA